MGKSNNVCNKFEKFYQRNTCLNDFLKKNEIEILKTINNCFIDQFIDFFSKFIKNSIKLVSYNIEIETFNINKKIIKNSEFLNLIEISPFNFQTFIIFSHDFLSVTIDFLFGGQTNYLDKNKKTKDLTFSESCINKKIIDCITYILSKIYKKYISPDIKFINTEKFFDFQKSSLNANTVFLINYFNFNINNIEVFFKILVPISIFKNIGKVKKIVLPIRTSDKNIYKNEKIIKNRICLNDIYNVELNISAKIIDISTSNKKINNLSVGDIFLIKHPDKIIGFIEDQPVFFGEYKRFNQQSIIFIEEFINNNLDFNEDKEYLNE